jgi:signal transduction histidine kinase
VTTEKIKILYIDDEVNNLNSFKASFRRDYDIYVSNTIDSAYEILKDHKDIVAVLSDQRMPEKTGVDFFEEIQLKYPLPVRILVTAYTDVESVIAAINRGKVYRFIKKPWDEMEMRGALNEAFLYYQLTSSLQKKNEELRIAYNEIDKFAYLVTHDLRGPMVSIHGIMDMLKSDDDINHIKEMLTYVETAMQKLLQFVDNTNEYYRINRGELSIHTIYFDDLIKDIEDIYVLDSGSSDIKFNSSITNADKIAFRTDEQCLRLVLNNLVSNAIKYQKMDATDKHIDVNVDVKRDQAIITVSDNGIGIQADYIDNIYNMFYRATTQAIGSGFGLYNVKEALMKIGGEISVDSVYGKGTTFTVRIPNK